MTSILSSYLHLISFAEKLQNLQDDSMEGRHNNLKAPNSSTEEILGILNYTGIVWRQQNYNQSCF
jgi:hypothetical protein